MAAQSVPCSLQHLPAKTAHIMLLLERDFCGVVVSHAALVNINEVSPLSLLDTGQAGLPSPSEPDSYLQSKIDRFYIELLAKGTT